MKKFILPTVITFLSICFLLADPGTMYSYSTIEQLRPTEKDVPAGFRFGLIPDFAKSLLKDNPWKLDRPAIKKLAHRIYPGGEQSRISDIHMTIIANSKKPYGDDIVCYIFLFRDSRSAAEEVKKLNDFTGYNSDRAVVLHKKNIAVYLHVDSVKDFPAMKDLSEKILKRMESL